VNRKSFSALRQMGCRQKQPPITAGFKEISSVLTPEIIHELTRLSLIRAVHFIRTDLRLSVSANFRYIFFPTPSLANSVHEHKHFLNNSWEIGAPSGFVTQSLWNHALYTSSKPQKYSWEAYSCSSGEKFPGIYEETLKIHYEYKLKCGEVGGACSTLRNTKLS
jgi:hypothetical protein